MFEALPTYSADQDTFKEVFKDEKVINEVFESA